MLSQRLISGTVLAIAIIGLVLLDGWLSTRVRADGPAAWFGNGAITAAVVLTLTLLTVRELNTLAHAHNLRPLRFEAYLFAGGLTVGPYISFNSGDPLYNEAWGMLWLAVALGYTFWMQALRRGTHNAMVNVATTLFILFYAGGLAGYLTKLRMEIGGFEGAVLLLFSVLVVKITDIGAYFTGRLLGRHKLIPWLSPKKTWEGLIGGVVAAVLCAWGVGVLLERNGWLPAPEPVLASELVVFGLAMALFSIAGDLTASLLKRDAAVKDSGNFVPGMGGILDVFDSPLLAAPAAWFFWTRVAPLWA